MKVKNSLARYNSVSKIEGKIGGKVNGLLGRKQTNTEAPSGSSDSTAATAATTSQDPASPEPMVLHGHTLTKATTFRDVCSAIRDSAFVVTDLPVIISLEVHAGHDQQQMMVDIMEETWKGYLVEIPTETEPMKILPSLEKLKRKILIKAKWAPANPAEQIGEDIENFIEERQPIERQQSQNQEAGANTLTSKTAVAPAAPAPTAPAARSAVPAAPAAPPKKPSKTLHALSRLAVYTKGFHFSHFEQPEAKMPDHVFSLSENAAKNAHTKEREALFNHNRNFFMRVYPGGLRVNSSNLDPTFFWRTGAQIVALNWQSLDKGMMLNHGMFAGEQGWVLKPQGYKSTETKPNALVDRKLDLTIEVLAGQGISLPPGHTKEKSFHPYVSCSLHVEQPDEDATIPSEDDSTDAEKTSYKRTIKYSTGSNPDFREQKLQFPTVSGIDEELSFVRLVFLIFFVLSCFVCSLLPLNHPRHTSNRTTKRWVKPISEIPAFRISHTYPITHNMTPATHPSPNSPFFFHPSFSFFFSGHFRQAPLPSISNQSIRQSINRSTG
ncbi:hypothetical protein ASPWEDRAFT_554955 [Aspergillus wentii DTO 134E9]|uniref:Phosphoinositide phospholipase C n=1 Tax=Aspergillus wentii DTO 134E9 TaxID=1073089 RepID=A0A1L9RGI2_ASPWE|nr:uncharacterized protein ASPWEDRAFT_554955 [Aspergillus wentii DTO 134E9]OJJ34035.1 hypothetical protein ASPWEDRAFT_554955 [Aspergillus wentii DTO 134E9]